MYPFCDGEVFFVDRSLLMGAKGSIIKNRTTVAIWSGYIKEIEEFGGSHILKVKMSEKQWEHFHAHFWCNVSMGNLRRWLGQHPKDNLSNEGDCAEQLAEEEWEENQKETADFIKKRHEADECRTRRECGVEVPKAWFEATGNKWNPNAITMEFNRLYRAGMTQ